MILPDETLLQITEMSAALLPSSEIAILLDIPAEQHNLFCDVCKNHRHSPIYSAYHKGRLQTKLNLRKTVIKLAQFRGALALKIIQEIGNFHEYTPLQVKKSLTGKAKAAKEQVAFMVKTHLGLKEEIRPLDITDAIAVAITHAQRVNLRRN